MISLQRYHQAFKARDKRSSGNTVSFPPISIERQVASPQRYCVDKDGHRILVGLSVQETFEFETLDDIAPLDETGARIAWSEGVPTTSREMRWLELYQKHDAAWKALAAGTRQT